MKEIKINIFKLIGIELAVFPDAGEILYRCIIKGLKNNIIILDFKDIKLITPTFLNSAIGQLYYDHSSSFLRGHLKLEHMLVEDMYLLKKVISNAKAYYQNQINKEKL